MALLAVFPHLVALLDRPPFSRPTPPNGCPAHFRLQHAWPVHAATSSRRGSAHGPGQCLACTRVVTPCHPNASDAPFGWVFVQPAHGNALSAATVVSAQVSGPKR
ncbi:hypothetical protein BDN70DRAFT_940135 [Pholiota conissans]|uniref:Uncharacterized protein n=1 Tax=Pholiota conissans TaxID=109636 RepID=A0A9P5YJT0_9AGAR|nr:hypothetical protein BDN70DRAFT_940135 [Pholiota conissans]